MVRRLLSGRPYASVWKVWLPVIAILLALDVSFDAWFWRIPKVTGTNADFGYQFLVDARPLREPAPAGTVRVTAFGSSVAGSFDPRQVASLLRAAAPDAPVDVHRLLLPAAHPTDYALYFEHADLPAPGVAVVLFNLVDFLFSGSERDVNPTLRYILPPLPLLREHRSRLSTSSELDLLVAAASDLYRFRRPLRSCLQDHVRALQRWARTRPARAAYGVYADGFTERRFGLPTGDATRFALRYYIDPEWLLQRGVVRMRFESSGVVLAERIEAAAGWQTIELPLPEQGEAMIHVTLDSTWSPRVTGADDLRLLGVQLDLEVAAAAGEGGRAPFRYRPREPADIDTLLRMRGASGEEFVRRWDETLAAETRFGERFRVYSDAKRAVSEQTFAADAEFGAIERLTAHFAERGTRVVLVNTPESPLLLADYGDSEYYRAYRRYFRDLAERYPGTRFVDLSEVLPAEDFNDLHHPSFVGAIKLGPVYVDVVREALGRLPWQDSAEAP